MQYNGPSHQPLSSPVGGINTSFPASNGIDQLTHTHEHPFCEDRACVCHWNEAYLERHCGPLASLVLPQHLLTPQEALYFYRRFSLPSPDPATLSTAWMPLDAIARQWADFGTEFESVQSSLALRLVSLAFGALSWETQARHSFEQAMTSLSSLPPAAQCDAYRDTLQTLHEAHRTWQKLVDALLIPMLVGVPECSPLHNELLRLLEEQAQGQARRLDALIDEVRNSSLAFAVQAALTPPRSR